MVRDYINDKLEIETFKNHIIETNKLLDYHNKMIKELNDTMEIYIQIINNLEREILIRGIKYEK